MKKLDDCHLQTGKALLAVHLRGRSTSWQGFISSSSLSIRSGFASELWFWLLGQ
jgi:hypothetical protein